MSGLFVPLEASYTEDAKVQAVSERAELLFIRGLCYCKLHYSTDGFIHRRALGKVAPFSEEVPPLSLADELVAAGLWKTEDDGYRVVAWLSHNPSSAEIDDKKRKEAERKAKWRRERDAGTGASRDASATDTQSHGESHAHSSLSRHERVDAALGLLADVDCDNFELGGGTIGNRRAFRATCLAARSKDHNAALHKLAHENPEWTTAELADAVAGEPEPAAPLRPVPNDCFECGWTVDDERPHAYVHSEWVAS